MTCDKKILKCLNDNKLTTTIYYNIILRSHGQISKLLFPSYDSMKNGYGYGSGDRFLNKKKRFEKLIIILESKTIPNRGGLTDCAR